MHARSAITWLLALALAAPAAADPCAPDGHDPLAGLGDVLRSIEDRAGERVDPCGPATETDHAFDAELASLDVASLPAVLDLGALTKRDRAVVAYLLERDLDSIGATLSKDDLSATHPGRAILGAFAVSKAKGGAGTDVLFLRKALTRLYNCTRSFPPTLEEFMRSRFAWTVGEGHVVASKPKRGPRRLLGSPDGSVLVAETLNADGSVRETEIILKGTRADGALDFVTYDANGRLDTASEFPLPSGEHRRIDSPYICMGCHQDMKTMRFDVVTPFQKR